MARCVAALLGADYKERKLKSGEFLDQPFQPSCPKHKISNNTYKYLRTVPFTTFEIWRNQTVNYEATILLKYFNHVTVTGMQFVSNKTFNVAQVGEITV